MAGPANPFAGLGQKDVTAGSGGAGGGGRGAFGRSTPYQPKAPGGGGAPTRGSTLRGRGRGASTTRGRGRGGHTANGGAQGQNPFRNNNKVEAQAGSDSGSSSPFAQLRQGNKPAFSPFGGQASQQSTSSPFSSVGKGSGFGAPSSTFDGTMVDASRDPRQRPVSRPMNGATGSAVPVEDGSILGSYNDRYEQLKLDRAKEREKAIREGQMADPNQPTSLNQAITPVGTCTSMCPEFERVERIVQKMVDKSEKFLHPSTNTLQNMETKMLKRFRRSAAGYDEQLPSDIRTPKTLLQTMNYLIRHVVGGPEPLGIIHKFVWDRTRSIRNDLSVQQLTQEEHVQLAVTCLERIARFHIVSLHLLSSPANEEPFDRHQEREQLNNTMLSLMYYYDDNRGRIQFPNEDEFRAYYIIFSIHDQRPDLEARVQKWPAELRNSPKVQVALELFAAAGNTWEYQGTLDAKRPNAIAQGFYARFFSLIDSPAVSYLMACVAEIYFNHMRQTAIRSIWKGYCRAPASQQHKNEEWTIDELTTVLCFDSDSQTISFCEEQDLQLAENANGELYLNWGSRPVDSVAFQPSSEHSFSEKIVESKRSGRTLAAIILGLNIKEAVNLGMIDSSLLSQRTASFAAPKFGATDDDSLFVSDDDNEMQTSTFQPNGVFSTLSQPAAPAAPAESPDSASSLRNGFDDFSQATTSTAPSLVQSDFSTGFPAQPSVSQPVEPAKPFSSLFPSGNTANPFGASPTPSNPFSNVSSPFASPKLPETSQSNGPFSAAPTTQKPPIFPTGPSIFSSPAPKSDATPAPAASTTPQFKLPGFTPPTTSAPASLFSSPTTTPATTSDKPAGLTAGQPPASLFSSVKPPTFPATSGSLFNFSGQSPVSNNSISQISEEKEASAEPAPSPKPTGLFAPKADTPSIFPPVSTTPSSSIFSSSNSTTASSVGQGGTSETKTVAETESSAKQDGDVSTLEEHTSPHTDSVTQPEVPSFTPNASITSTAPIPAAEEPPITTDDLVQPPEAEEPPVEEEKPILPEVADRRSAWIEALKETANRRRQESSAGRKRVYDEQPEQEPVDTGAKAAKVPKPSPPVPRKPSMALSSIKPLPKLPILEQIESLTARKPAAEQKKPEEPKPSQVDEDELLLSAARIAAESLRSGPKLVHSTSAYYEPRRSFSPGSSFSSSLPLSRSMSPPQSHVNGYDLAYAPDNDLGLGRTLSRTEQRLRLTGGKGLAYKPLDFTPGKSRKSLGGK
ncbi:hypothetical protein AWENTII_003645 [Aspergillus wentii]|nr:hypothetical protein MW887_011715 [Aspergillus wentii]